jgi:hypothetical protein
MVVMRRGEYRRGEWKQETGNRKGCRVQEAGFRVQVLH